MEPLQALVMVILLCLTFDISWARCWAEGGVESYSGTPYNKVYVVFIGAEAAGLLTTYGIDWKQYQHRISKYLQIP